MSSDPQKLSVLFCCLGNICRSPMAESAFRHTVSSLGHARRFATVDSCGTAAYHSGSSPDPRTLAVLRDNGISTDHRARQVRDDDFTKFDYVLAMDRANLRDLERRRPKGAAAKVMLFGHFSDSRGEIVEDPYYGGPSGFQENFEQVVRMSKRFLKEVLEVDVQE